jgi:glycosyltransferase involved in cell wall biosynthesis
MLRVVSGNFRRRRTFSHSDANTIPPAGGGHDVLRNVHAVLSIAVSTPIDSEARDPMTSHLPGVLMMVSSLETGGAEKHAVALANSLDPKRFRTSLCHLKAAQGATLARELDQSRVDSLLGLNVRRKLDWSAVVRLAGYIDDQQIDLIVCTNSYPLLYALLAARVARRRSQLVEVFHTTGYSRLVRSRLRVALNAMAFRRCALLVYVSERQREFWHAHRVRAKREVVIHNGIDTTLFTDRYCDEQKAALRAQFGCTPDDYVIGICAKLRPEKQHGDLLVALHRVRNAGIPARLLIIGEGPERSSIERRIGELGLREAVAIAGYQPDVRPFIASCDVMVLSSHVIETFSIAALEAMSLGKPMVMSRVGGADEQITDGVHGLLFEPGDVVALAQHLQMLAAPELRSRMGAAAALRVRESFTIQRMVASFTDELQKLSDGVALTPTVAS